MSGPVHLTDRPTRCGGQVKGTAVELTHPSGLVVSIPLAGERRRSPVLSPNLHRRHLNPSQLAMVGARAIYDRQAKERQKAGQEKGRQKQKGFQENLPETTSAGQARDLAGKAVGVCGR